MGQSPINERGFIMREFFSLDGAFNRYGGFLADMIILSLMWLLFSLPVITIGASTAALFYVATRRIANREGYITGDFWLAFKANFVRGTALWAIIAVVALLLIFNIMNMDLMGGMSIFLLPAQIILLVQVAFITVFLFPVTARFEMGVKQTLKTCFFMANRHLLTSILCTLLFFAMLIGVFWLMPPIIFVAPGAYAVLSSYLLVRIFKKYRPEMDRDPVLEIQELEAQKAEERRRAGISSGEDYENGNGYNIEEIPEQSEEKPE